MVAVKGRKFTVKIMMFTSCSLMMTNCDLWPLMSMEILCWWQTWKEILIKQLKISLGTCIMKLYVLSLLNHPIKCCCTIFWLYLENPVRNMAAYRTRECVSQLSFCLRKLNTEPSIHVDASFQVSVHMAKQFQRRRFFRNRPIGNKNCLWWPCLITDLNEMSNLYRGPSIDDSYQVSGVRLFECWCKFMSLFELRFLSVSVPKVMWALAITWCPSSVVR
jgi:hypothetical protein